MTYKAAPPANIHPKAFGLSDDDTFAPRIEFDIGNIVFPASPPIEYIMIRRVNEGAKELPIAHMALSASPAIRSVLCLIRKLKNPIAKAANMAVKELNVLIWFVIPTDIPYV